MSTPGDLLDALGREARSRLGGARGALGRRAEGARVYRGRSVEELIPQIESDLGSDAIILRRREGLAGGVLGFFQHQYVELEAVPGTPGVDVYDEPEPTPLISYPPAAEPARAPSYAPAPRAEPPPASPPAPALERRPISAAPPVGAPSPAAMQPPAAPLPLPAEPSREPATSGTYLTGHLAALARRAAATAPPPTPPLRAPAPETRVPSPAPVDFQDLLPRDLEPPGALRYTFEAERPAFEAERPEFEAERREYEAERPEFEPERPIFAPEPPAFEAGRPAFEPERPAFEPGRPAFDAEHPAFDAERPAFEPGRPVLEPARAAFEAERAAFEAERRAFEAERRAFEAVGRAPEPERPAPEPERPAPEPERPAPEPEHPAFEAEAPRPTPERRTVAPGSHARARAGVEKSLRRFGISEEMAAELIDAAAAHTLPLAPRSGLAQAVRATLAQRIPVAPPLPLKGAAIVLVGAGGSGKTTCCATLLEAYRDASTLTASYATVLWGQAGGELQMILSPQLMKPTPAATPKALKALARARVNGLAVIDTPGVSRADRAGIRALSHLLGEMAPERVVIALPATLGAAAARQLLDALEPLGAQAVAVTHADETDQVGVAIEAACRFGLAPEYLLDRNRSGAWRLSRIDPTSLAAKLLQ